jgi:hypothetical protein
MSQPDVSSISFFEKKIQVQNYVLEKAKQGLIEYTLPMTGLFSIIKDPWLIKCTGGLAEYFFTTEFYGFNYKERSFHRLGDGKKATSFTSLMDTGKYVVAMLKCPELTKNASVFVSSFEADYVTIIEALEEETGEKIQIYEETPEEQLEYGVPEPFVALRSMLLDGRGLMTRRGEKLWNNCFPEVEPQTLENVVKIAVAQLNE